MPLVSDLKNSKFSYHSYVKYFGSIKKARSLAGLSKNEVTKEMIAVYLKKLALNGKSPTSRKFRRLCSDQDLYRNFASYNDALIYAGLKPNVKSKKETNRTEKN